MYKPEELPISLRCILEVSDSIAVIGIWDQYTTIWPLYDSKVTMLGYVGPLDFQAL